MTTVDYRLRVRPFTERDRDASARVVVRAFPDKFAAMLDGRIAAGPSIVATFADPANTWVAERNGAVIGVATVQDVLAPAPRHRLWPVLRRRLTRVAALRAALHLWLIHTVSVPSDLLYLDSVAVDPAAQGNGVGGALLEVVVDEARRRGKRAVGLYVIARNDRARALYERKGFVAQHSEELRMFVGVAGFGRTIYMERELAAPAVARPADTTSADSQHLIGRLVASVLDRALWRRGAV